MGSELCKRKTEAKDELSRGWGRDRDGRGDR